MSVDHLLSQASEHLKAQQFPEAEMLYRQIVAAIPKDDAALFMLGMIRYNRKDYQEALHCISQALRLNPTNARYCYNIGVVWRDAGYDATALLAFQAAARLNPAYVAAHYNSAIIYRMQGRWEDALAACDRVLALEPQHKGAYSTKGGIYYQHGQYAQALPCYQKAVALHPGHADDVSNLAVLLSDMGRNEEAIALFTHAISLPECPAFIHSNLLFSLHYDPAQDCRSLFAAHLAWDARYGTASSPPTSHTNLKDPDKILHIGYVSGDFRAHPVGFFLMGVLAHHNPAQVKIYGYHNSHATDEVTAQLQRFMPQFRDISRLPDAEAEACIRNDRIDILVDLSGHTSDNRLPLFARKPAPVQLSWLGYYNTTGMQAMDYFITDPVHAPVGMEEWFMETLIRLPKGYMCYTPPAHAPLPVPAPSLAQGYITFGCFNNSNKINNEVVCVWAEILRQVPGSRLLLKAKGWGAVERRRQCEQAFKAEGIDLARIELCGWSDYKTMLKQYHAVDIALDPFPFSGGLTSCDALFMGVPVITYAGEWLVSRQTASYLTQMGVTALIADNKAAYIDIAVKLSQNREQLNAVRMNLRERMQTSPLCDSKGFTQQLENAYQDIWQRWCNN